MSEGPLHHQGHDQLHHEPGHPGRSGVDLIEVLIFRNYKQRGAAENAPDTAVHATSGETAACTRMQTSTYRPYVPINGASPPRSAMALLTAFLRYGGSLELTAKELNIHPNTVRYRLKRAAETTGWDATDPRDAFVLNTAIAIGRMRDA